MAKRRLIIPISVSLLVGVVVAAVAGSCAGGDGSSRIRLGAVGRSDVAEVVEAPATVTPRATAVLRSPAQGTIGQLYVADGHRVEKGDVLAKIDSPAARERLAQAREADRTAAGGNPVPAGIGLTAFQSRTDRTARRGFDAARGVARRIPDRAGRARVLAEIAKAEGQYAAAAQAARTAVARLNAGLGSITSAMESIGAAQRVQTRAAVRAAERTVDGLTLRAPFSGVAGLGGPAGQAGGLGDLADQLPQQLRSQAPQGGGAPLGGALGGGGPRDASSVAEGAPAGAGDAIVTVTDVSKLTLTADVDETDVLQVRTGVRASVELDAVPGGRYEAEVTGVGVTPKESSGGGVTYKVTLALGEGTTSAGGRAPRPKPGMSAVADLKVKEVRGALSVPSSAVVTSGRDSTVWVVAGGRAERRVVGLGAQGDALVQVRSGLREGDKVVVRGADAVEQDQEIP